MYTVHNWTKELLKWLKSQKVFPFGSNLPKNVPSHYPEIYPPNVKMLRIWGYWSQREKLSEIRPSLANGFTKLNFGVNFTAM